MDAYTCPVDDCGIKPSKRMNCSGCGHHMWKSSTSKPEGEAQCRTCRAQNRTRNTDGTWTWRCKQCRRSFTTKRARTTCDSCERATIQLRNAAEGNLCNVTGCDRGVYYLRKGTCAGHGSSEWYRKNKRQRPHPRDWITNTQRQAIYERDAYKCHLCGTETLHQWDPGNARKSPSLDHIIPRSQGGTDHPNNLRVACLSCNASRQDKPVYEWLHEQETRLTALDR